MYKGKTILAIVPARGGSKGVPLKNIHPLLSRPLVAYVGDIVRDAGYFDKAVVSTDHPQIAEVALSSGLEVPFYRPEHLSGDLIGDYEVLIHALTEVERLENTSYDVIAMLQPTCPLRKTVHVTAVITKLIEEDWDAVWTISKTDVKYHPLKAFSLAPDGTMNLYEVRGKTIIARQQLDQVYHRNGAAYAFSRRCLIEEKSTLPIKTSAVVLDDPIISIDSLEDFDIAEELLRKRRLLHSSLLDITSLNPGDKPETKNKYKG